MRDLFPGYYRPDEHELTALWREAVFIFDANALLNVYRFPSGSRDLLLEIIQHLGERVWIPHQAADEYHRNIHRVVVEQAGVYRILSNAIDRHLAGIRTDLLNHRFRTPVDVERIVASFERVAGRVRKDIDATEAKHPQPGHYRRIQDRLADLLQGKVGPSFTSSEMDEACKEAEYRYGRLIPPGFKDSRKNDPDRRPEDKYGDYVLWKQILSFAKKIGRPIVIISDEQKEDWIRTEKGVKLGPHPSLSLELWNVAGVLLGMTSTPAFMERASAMLGLPAPAEAVRQAREVTDEVRLPEEVQEKLDENLAAERAATRDRWDRMSVAEHRRGIVDFLGRMVGTTIPPTVGGMTRITGTEISWSRRHQIIDDLEREGLITLSNGMADDSEIRVTQRGLEEFARQRLGPSGS